MSRGASKRKLRIRRKRRDDVADREADVTGISEAEVVGEFGCCVIEAVGSVSILIGLLLVPTYLLLG